MQYQYVKWYRNDGWPYYPPMFIPINGVQQGCYRNTPRSSKSCCGNGGICRANGTQCKQCARNAIGMMEDIEVLKSQSDMQKYFDKRSNAMSYDLKVKPNGVYVMGNWFDLKNADKHFTDEKSYMGFSETLMSTINITLKDDFGVWHSLSKLKKPTSYNV